MLAGVMIEGEGGITGTVLTKRWMEFDAETKSGLIKTYGGYGGLYSAAQWSGGNNFFENGVGPFFNRCCNQSCACVLALHRPPLFRPSLGTRPHRRRRLPVHGGLSQGHDQRQVKLLHLHPLPAAVF